jgi:hypothetical protein
MPDLTEEEYSALDEYWTKNTPEIDTGKPGFVTRRMETPGVKADKLTATWLRAREVAAGRTTTRITGESARGKIAGSN